MTSLAQQLQRLAIPQSFVSNLNDRSRPSLLFDSKVAATIDKDTFYGLGLNGFQELCVMEPSLQAEYFDDLFGEIAKDTERTIKSKEFNENLDLKINSFLLRLSPYFLLRPAQKCMEWLIYRFRINYHNIDSLIRSTLPYYGTNMFVRVIQLLDSKQSMNKWTWIAEAQTDGIPITKMDVISVCKKNLSFLEFICDTVTKVLKIYKLEQDSWKMRGFINLFTSTILGVIHKMNAISEAFLLHVMPVVLKGIKSSLADLQSGCFMIVAQLAVKIDFESRVLVSLIDLTTKHCLVQLQSEAIRMIALLCQTQENLNKFTKRSFRRLSAMENFLSNIKSLSSNERFNNFLIIYFNSLLPRAFKSADAAMSSDSDDGSSHLTSNSYSSILKFIVEETKLSTVMQAYTFKLMIENFCKLVSVEEYTIPEMIQEVVQRMQQKYPDSFDLSISQCQDISLENLNKFLNLSLASAKHQLLSDSSMTLSLAIIHPEPNIRHHAVLNLSTCLSGSECSDETKTFACKSIFQILKFDSDIKVVKAALELLINNPEIFEEKRDIVCGHLMEIISSKWTSTKWASVLHLATQCLTSYGSLVAVDATSSLEYRVVLLILRLYSQNFATSSVDRKFISTLTKSKFVKQNELLKYSSSILPSSKNKDDHFEKFIQNLVRIFESKNLLKYLINLLETFDECSDIEAEYFSPVLYLLLIVSLKETGENTLFEKACVIMIKQTKIIVGAVLRQECDFSSDDDAPTMLSNLFALTNSSQIMNLSCFIIIRLWNDVITKLSQYINSSESGSVTTSSLRESVFEILIGISQSSPIPDVINTLHQLLEAFFENMFDGADHILEFLSKIWLKELCLEWNKENYSQTLCIRSLQTGCAVMRSLQSQPNTVSSLGMFQISSFVIPSVLLACTSLCQLVRSEATEFLQVSSSLTSCSAVADLLSYLKDHLEEIRLDSSHCGQALEQYFQVQDKPHKGKRKNEHNLRNKLLKEYISHHVVSRGKTSRVGVKFYERCLFQIKNEIEFDVLLPEVNKLLVHFDSTSDTFNDDNSLISLMLQKITSNLFVDERSETFFLKALASDLTDISDHNSECETPQTVALEHLSGKFFASLSDGSKKDILISLIDATVSASETTRTAVSRIYKSITLHSSHVIHLLEKWGIMLQPLPAQQSSLLTAKRARLQQSSKSPQKGKVLWKHFVVTMEMLHHKKRIQRPQDLIGPLFDVLNNVIDGKYEAPNTEYITLLLLGCLLNVFNRTKKFDNDVVSNIKNNMKVELLVKCIHSTENTQTHQHALFLLAKAARFCPDKVLHSVMSVFTFMGNTLLRRDDSYSFQVITQTINTVIPPLLSLEKQSQRSSSESSVVGILRVFVDAIPHIPAHRRLKVFEEVLQSVGAEDHLYEVLVLFMDQYICEIPNSASLQSNSPERSPVDSDPTLRLETSLQFWTSVCELFSAELEIKSVINILHYLQVTLDDNGSSQNTMGVHLIDLKKRSSSQLGRFRIISLTLAVHLLRQMRHDFAPTEEESDGKGELITSNIQELLKCGLMYLDHVISASETMRINMSARYHQALVKQIEELLDKATSLLPIKEFLLVLSSLLSHQFSSEKHLILQKAISLFNHRVSQGLVVSTDAENELFMNLGERFLGMLKEGCKSDEINVEPLRAAAHGLTQIIRLSSKRNPKRFVPVQPIICDVVSSNQLPDNLIASLLNCLGEVSINLKAHSIVNISQIATCLINLLDEQRLTNSYVALASLLVTTNKLFNCLGHFLSPYLSEFLFKLSVLSFIKQSGGDHVTSGGQAESKHSSAKRDKKTARSNPPIGDLTTNVLNTITTKVSSRILVPTLRKAYDMIMKRHPMAVSILVQIITSRISKMEKKEVASHSGKLMEFYLHNMDFRTTCNEVSFPDIQSTEEIAIEGTISLLIKLPEAVFRSLYLKLYDWGSSDRAPSTRVTTFYKCTATMAAKLKGLFEIFARDLLNNITEALKETADTQSSRLEEEWIYRLSCILDTLQPMLMHSSSSFLTQDKFEKIVHPLVDQLEVTASNRLLIDDYITNHVIPCIGQLASTAHECVAWQPLNYHVLMKSRNSSPQTRCHSLKCLQAIVENLGDDYRALLPETIPFLAELMEDECDDVEECCQGVIRKMEEILGESLQKFF